MRSCPPISNDDILPWLLYLSLFYDWSWYTCEGHFQFSEVSRTRVLEWRDIYCTVYLGQLRKVVKSHSGRQRGWRALWVHLRWVITEKMVKKQTAYFYFKVMAQPTPKAKELDKWPILVLFHNAVILVFSNGVWGQPGDHTIFWRTRWQILSGQMFGKRKGVLSVLLLIYILCLDWEPPLRVQTGFGKASAVLQHSKTSSPRR